MTEIIYLFIPLLGIDHPVWGCLTLHIRIYKGSQISGKIQDRSLNISRTVFRTKERSSQNQT